jgi:hypothetical protein
MAFDPLSWAIGYALKKGLDHFLAHKSLSLPLEKGPLAVAFRYKHYGKT